MYKSLVSNVQRIEEILQDFRDFVSATKLNFQVVDLNQVLEETVKELLPKRSEVKLELNLKKNLPQIQLDTIKFKRAIGELIENSFHFFDPLQDSALVRISTRLISPHDTDLPHWALRGQAIRLSIEDTGSGVKDELKDKIFEPFFTSRVKGMGLGLSIVKGIVEAHGGYIFEMGIEGRGAKFVILLPVTERP